MRRFFRELKDYASRTAAANQHPPIRRNTLLSSTRYFHTQAAITGLVQQTVQIVARFAITI
jgi:hypothetical protein